jgi:hypothetical protein
VKIFISWSGEKSRKIADEIKKWLPDVIQSVRPYFTPDDVAKGQRWAAEIAESLHTSQFGIFCLTAENLNAPWILFEAGALSKDRDISKVCPILFGVDTAHLTGPLVQFQATPYSRPEMLKFVSAVNDATNQPLSEVQLTRAFDRYWEEFDENVQAILTQKPDDETLKARPLEEMVEETLDIVRSISLNPASSDPFSHWLVFFQSTLEYARDTLKIAENADQSAMLDQLRRLHDYLKLVANLMSPKLKNSTVGPTYTAQVNKVLKQISARIESLSLIIDDGEL